MSRHYYYYYYFIYLFIHFTVGSLHFITMTDVLKHKVDILGVANIDTLTVDILAHCLRILIKLPLFTGLLCRGAEDWLLVAALSRSLSSTAIIGV